MNDNKITWSSICRNWTISFQIPILAAILVLCVSEATVASFAKQNSRGADDLSSAQSGARSLSAVQIIDPGAPDTLWVNDNVIAQGGASDVTVSLFNDEGIVGASVGLTWSTADLSLDSVSYTGTRIDALPNEQTFATIDNINRTVIIGFVELSSPVQPLSSGSGAFATLWFSAAPGAAEQPAVIDSAFVPPAGEFVFSNIDNEAFVPQFRSGVLNILSDTDGDGVVDIGDNCPSKFNPLQEDFDGDGLGDSCFLPAYLFPLTFVARPASGSSGLMAPPSSMFPPGDAEVNLTVTDPDGDFIGADSLGNITNTIGSDANYFDIETQDSIVINTPKTGDYTVSVVAKAGGTTTGALYTIFMRTDGTVQNQVGSVTSVPDFGVTETATAKTEPYSFGDANDDRAFNIADVTFLIAWIFGGGPGPNILDAADSNCDGSVNIADVTYNIAFIFVGGSPAPGCG